MGIPCRSGPFMAGDAHQGVERETAAGRGEHVAGIIGTEQPASPDPGPATKRAPRATYPARRKVSFARWIPSASLAPVGTARYAWTRKVCIARAMHGIS
jgi:hypothetical protein